MFDADVCYRALAAKDRRFDGLFFVGVETTGIYCRPVCTARTPRRDRCTFYRSSALAEQAGFRACFVCRPELAPGSATIDATDRLVRNAVAHVDAGFLNDHGVDDLADRLGVTARHLRRATNEALGVTPVELAQTRRLALAKQLLQDTSMSLADVAFAAGFSSVRRFNASFAERFAMPPSEVRRRAPRGTDETLRLDFRPPLAWGALLDFLRVRAIPGVEQVDDGYARVVAFGDDVGTVRVALDPKRAALRVAVSGALMPHLMPIVARVRSLFDLDARPDAIAERLGADTTLAAAVAAQPGLRIPGAFDPFETLVRTVLGQQVSVKGATTLAGRFVERYGERVGDGPLSHRFPSPERIARATG
ncbi:MAG: AlkA N-terminal domain-containing protein, partial [Deltaproteobacteria bacterium]